jgi:hypothetical protein
MMAVTGYALLITVVTVWVSIKIYRSGREYKDDRDQTYS